eukprot:6182974-Pleurochrysis_carterae.AAC.1
MCATCSFPVYLSLSHARTHTQIETGGQAEKIESEGRAEEKRTAEREGEVGLRQSERERGMGEGSGHTAVDEQAHGTGYALLGTRAHTHKHMCTSARAHTRSSAPALNDSFPSLPHSASDFALSPSYFF